MDISKYIESGILELYALSLLSEIERAEVSNNIKLYPELSEELTRIELALEQFAHQQSISPPGYLKKDITAIIENLQSEKELSLSNLPLINKYSDFRNWLTLVESLGEIPIPTDGIYVQTLRDDAEVTQQLIVSSLDVPEEIHESEQESFLILSGDCECTIGNEVRYMSAGDYMSIPMFQPHHVKVLSPKVMAILQHIKA